jgi:hypothetical protein
MSTESFRQPSRQIVRASVAAKQWHDAGAILRKSKHRRLPKLFGNERCEDADQDARRADSYDWAAGLEERAKLVALQALDVAADCGCRTLGSNQSGVCQRNEDRIHVWARAVRIIEK